MATIHHTVKFEVPPKLEVLLKKLKERTGLKMVMGLDSIEAGHNLPDLGEVREAGSLECDEAGDSDLDLTVADRGVRVDVLAGTNRYFRDSVLAALQDLGGHPDHKPGASAAKPWAKLSAEEKAEAVE